MFGGGSMKRPGREALRLSFSESDGLPGRDCGVRRWTVRLSEMHSFSLFFGVLLPRPGSLQVIQCVSVFNVKLWVGRPSSSESVVVGLIKYSLRF